MGREAWRENGREVDGVSLVVLTGLCARLPAFSAHCFVQISQQHNTYVKIQHTDTRGRNAIQHKREHTSAGAHRRQHGTGLSQVIFLKKISMNLRTFATQGRLEKK